MLAAPDGEVEKRSSMLGGCQADLKSKKMLPLRARRSEVFPHHEGLAGWVWGQIRENASEDPPLFLGDLEERTPRPLWPS